MQKNSKTNRIMHSELRQLLGASGVCAPCISVWVGLAGCSFLLSSGIRCRQKSHINVNIGLCRNCSQTHIFKSRIIGEHAVYRLCHHMSHIVLNPQLIETLTIQQERYLCIRILNYKILLGYNAPWDEGDFWPC